MNNLLNRSPEADAIARARDAIGDPICDPAQATRYLLEQAEQGLSNRADALANQYWRIHFRLTVHAQRTIAAKDAEINPQYVEVSRLETEGKGILAEIEGLIKTHNDPSTSKKRRREVFALMKRRAAILKTIVPRMNQSLTPVQESINQLGEEIAVAAPMWAGIQGAEKISADLRTSLLWARMRSLFLRLIFISVALGIAILVDRRTSFAESNLVSVSATSRHDVAVSVLFFLQAILFEPVFSKTKRVLAARGHLRLTRIAENLLMKIEEYERQMAKAEPALSRLEASVL